MKYACDEIKLSTTIRERHIKEYLTIYTPHK